LLLVATALPRYLIVSHYTGDEDSKD
jgi:hypothetical protein